MKTGQLIVWSLVAQLMLAPVSRAAAENYNLGLSTADEHGGDARGNEYTSGTGSGAVLMRVDLWGAVQKSGVHHIPPRTNLITLLSYAGGPLRDAETDNITIRRNVGGKPQNIDVDLSHVFNSPGAVSPVLEPNDIVVVPAIKPVVSNNTVLIASLIATAMSVVLASVVLKDQLKK